MSRNHKDRKICRGQTLLEVLIILSVVLVIITSILGLINASTRKATLARQTSEATKLVQEGLEIVRNIRDVDSAVVKVGEEAPSRPCNVFPYCTWAALYSKPQGDRLAHLSGGILVNDPSSPNNFETVSLGSDYRRTITISDNPSGGQICSDSGLGYDKVKRVTVTVEWDNPSGTQSKEAIECLTSWE